MEGHGEWLALGALLLPWVVLSLLLPLPHMVAALALLCALAAMLACAVKWARMRASAIGLDAEAWGLAAVLSLGYANGLLIGAAGSSAYQQMCYDCGKLSDARSSFCYACGTYA